MDVEIQSPYSGHRWFDKIRELVGPMPDQTKPWSDRWNDEMGEAVLAFLEGKDPQEGLTKARKDYNMMEYRQVYISQLEYADEERGGSWESRIVPTDVQPVAEDIEPVTYERQERVDWTKNSVRGLRAGKRKGSRGPNKSYRRFRGKNGDSDERWESI